MTYSTSGYEIAQVCVGLAKAWKFLSGEERGFAPCKSCSTSPTLTEFSYFMPLRVSADQRTGGLGVLIQRPDALDVATHMFGAEAACLQEPDLHDACAEVCNVLSGCLAQHIRAYSDIHLGLPFRASQAAYQQISTNSTIAAVYVSSAHNTQLYVVEYHIFSQPH